MGSAGTGASRVSPASMMTVRAGPPIPMKLNLRLEGDPT
jgi:hypothetical protein